MSQVEKLNLSALQQLIVEQEARIAALEAQVNKPKNSASAREMTDEDARRILSGDLQKESHKDAAAKLELSYGQIYSCRLEYTFKAIHKEMRESNIVNIWKKK